VEGDRPTPYPLSYVHGSNKNERIFHIPRKGNPLHDMIYRCDEWRENFYVYGISLKIAEIFKCWNLMIIQSYQTYW